MLWKEQCLALRACLQKMPLKSQVVGTFLEMREKLGY